MPNEGDRHGEIRKELIQFLLSNEFKEEDIHSSHGKRGIMLYHFNPKYQRKGNVNAVKNPDLAAVKDGKLFIIEIEIDNKPSTILGDLACIDFSTHICFTKDSEPTPIHGCFTIIVLDDEKLKEGSMKKEQINLLKGDFRCSGRVKDFSVCFVSDFRRELQSLMSRACVGEL